MAGGYMGKILDVNLSNGRIQEIPLSERVERELIGGYGIGARRSEFYLSSSAPHQFQLSNLFDVTHTP